MARTTGTYRETVAGGETVRAFMPDPLPPADPPLVVSGELAELHAEAVAAMGQLEVAGAMVPSAGWFLYGFTRKEALVSSQIEGTQATLMDVVEYEATEESERPADVEEVCNYVDALAFARDELAREDGLPLCIRLLCQAHQRLMQGVRGAQKQPGEIRTSQNWIGGTRPGNARYVPPPPDVVRDALADLEKWIQSDDPLPPLVRAGLAHVQFETIHPFLDGNGRIGRLMIALLVEHWGLLSSPLLYLSLAFKRRQQEYYRRLSAVRGEGDWEGWTQFFLECVHESATDGVDSARRLHALVGEDRRRVIGQDAATIPTVKLFDLLPEHPVVTSTSVCEMVDVSPPTAAKVIRTLCSARVLVETTGRARDRRYAYKPYLDVLSEDTEPSETPSPSSLSNGLQRTNERFGDALRRLGSDGGSD
jgi:Fic family protein